MLEGAKILGDYHGFVPYLGFGVSLESLTLNEENNGETISDVSEMKITPSFIFGWDIRPSRKGDFWFTFPMKPSIFYKGSIRPTKNPLDLFYPCLTKMHLLRTPPNQAQQTRLSLPHPQKYSNCNALPINP